jgi:hypothetical protein
LLGSCVIRFTYCIVNGWIYIVLLKFYRPANKAAGMASRDGDLDLDLSQGYE